MKILIISDSHNNSILKLPLTDYDYVIHCGDISSNDLDYLNIYDNIIYVRGNCDYNNYDLTKVLNLNNKKIFITHGNLYNVKGDLELLINNTINKYNIVCFGHTHKQLLLKKENTIYLNPGAWKNNEYAYIINDEVFLIKNNKCINKIKL